MEHIYQIIDCNSTAKARSCETKVLESRQKLLNKASFPEAKSCEALSIVFTKASALPIYTSPQYLSYIQNVGKSLHTAVSDIVLRWWDESSDLSARIPLDPKFERLLRRLDRENVPWQTGSWRPDFLIEQSDTSFPGMKICEINARFGFNGFFMLNGFAKYFQNDTSRLQPIGSDYVQTFGHLFDETRPVHLFKGRESGYDIHCMKQYCGDRAVFADVSQLQIVQTATGNRLFQVVDGKHVEIFQVALELHQDELLALSEDVLWELALRVRINDFRTIMLVHDKRMLAVVLEELENLVQGDILSDPDAALLAGSIAETYLPRTPGYQKAIESDRQEEWLFKPAGSGKGAGIVFRHDVPEEQWQEMLRTATPSHVLQRSVHHQNFDLRMPSAGRDSIIQVPWSLVGTFFMVDGYFGGMGPWRSSTSKICALSLGGSWMVGVSDREAISWPLHSQNHVLRRPSQTMSDHSADFNIFPPEVIEALSPSCVGDFSHVSKVYESLRDHGLALVHLNFSDPSSDYLVSLVRDGLHQMHGHGLPLDHSLKKGWLWDVKPIHGKVHSNSDPLARSETMNIFPWHTDCSFEPSPPRHFALHVLHADRYGGGSLSLVRTSDIVQELSEEAFSGLSKPEFEFAVPDEFDKGVSHTLVGALLDMSEGDPKLRYRRDIIKPLTRRAELALAELDEALESCQTASGRLLKKTMKAEDLPDGMVIVVDNARWLHARSQVNDPDRHLRRVRWNAQPFP